MAVEPSPGKNSGLLTISGAALLVVQFVGVIFWAANEHSSRLQLEQRLLSFEIDIRKDITHLETDIAARLSVALAAAVRAGSAGASVMPAHDFPDNGGPCRRCGAVYHPQMDATCLPPRPGEPSGLRPEPARRVFACESFDEIADRLAELAKERLPQMDAGDCG